MPMSLHFLSRVSFVSVWKTVRWIGFLTHHTPSQHYIKTVKIRTVKPHKSVYLGTMTKAFSSRGGHISKVFLYCKDANGTEKLCSH